MPKKSEVVESVQPVSISKNLNPERAAAIKDADEGVFNLKSQNARTEYIQRICIEGRKLMRQNNIPFCEACVHADFASGMQDLESGRAKTDKRIVLPKMNVIDYYGVDKFEKLNDHTYRNRDGIRIEIVQSVEWKCLARGHKVEIMQEPEYKHL